MIGTSKGPVLALNQHRLELRFKIHGKGAMHAKPALRASGDTICCFDGKGISVSPPLPTTASIQQQPHNSR